MAELVITLSDGRKLRHTLGSCPEVIGRDAHCDIPLDDPSASRRHARFCPTPAGYFVEDLGSKNGTLVNGSPCTTNVLRTGDKVQIGSAVAVYSESRTTTAGSVVIADEPTSSHATRYISRDQRLLLSEQRLRTIYGLMARLTTLQNRDQLLDSAMDICLEMLRFERGAIGVRRAESRVLDWPVVRNLRDKEGELTVSRSLLTRALENGERAIFTEGEAGSCDPTVSMVQHGIRSAMCVPLIHQDEILGVIYGDRLSTSASYSNEDIDFLAAIAQQVSIGLINCRLLEDQQRMIRLNHGLDLARKIQAGLFPVDLPQRPDFTVAAINDPGDRISGDYYDVIERADGRVWLLMADVTGEGVSAALLMANLQAAVRLTVAEADEPGNLLAHWNRLIFHNTDPSKFITCLLALVDPASNSIRVASAGHCLPFVIRPPRGEPVQAAVEHGYPLGVVEEAVYESTTLTLGPDPFAFFCYTDGVIEAMDKDYQTFGVDRLVEVLSEARALEPKALVNLVRKRVAGFAAAAQQSDDITLLAARVG